MRKKRFCEETWRTPQRVAEAALRNSASAPAAHQLLGHICFRQSKNEEAITHFLAASAAGRSAPDMTRDWSAALLALGRHEEARDILEKALSQDPTQKDLRYRLAGSYSAQGKWKEAWPHWEEVYRQGLQHGGVVLQLARARFTVGQDVEAVELLSGFATNTTAVDSLSEAGKLLFEKALYRQALGPLQKAWQQKPGAYDTGMYLALSHYLVEEYAASERILNAISVVPETSSEYSLLLGSIRARLEKWDEARKEFDSVLKRFPQRADGYLNYGLFCLDRGESKRAMDLFDQASRLETRGNKLLYAVRSRKDCEGLRPPEGTLQTDSHRSELYSQLAEQLYAGRQSVSALEVFRLALQADGRSERAYAGIGRICSETDSVREAQAFLERGLTSAFRISQPAFQSGIGPPVAQSAERCSSALSKGNGAAWITNRAIGLDSTRHCPARRWKPKGCGTIVSEGTQPRSESGPRSF